MKIFHIAMTSFLLVSVDGCHKGSSNHENSAPISQVKPEAKPIITLGLQGGLAVGSVQWTLPKFLEGHFQNLNHEQTEASIDIELFKDGIKKNAHINSGFQVKSCKIAEEVAAFTSIFAMEIPENTPENLQTDVFEISNWTAEERNFDGRIILQKRYKSDGDTSIYRFDALVANEKSSECFLWNFVITPSTGTTAEYIEGSNEYQALIESLVTTWEDLGTDFDK